jgi:DNA-binding transcriptional LysR family regulator
MHHRYDKTNIPIELLRTLVAIAELGSFTKAGSALNLTQSAISAQVKRLQQLVGAELFTKSGPGLRLTGQGEIVLGYAQRILAMNDQILSFGGTRPHGQPLRVGFPIGFAEMALPELINRCAPGQGIDGVQIRCDISEDMLKYLMSGRLDVAVLTSPSHTPAHVYCEWSEQMVFVRAPDFLLSPGAPLPLISWPSTLSDRVVIEACEQSGVTYSVAFVSADHLARNLAVQGGLGFVAMVERTVPSKLKIAREHYLPSLPKITGGIYLREALDRRTVEPLLQAMDTIFNPRHGSTSERAAEGVAKDRAR